MLRLFRINAWLSQKIDCPADQFITCLPEAGWVDAQDPDEQKGSLLQQMLYTDQPEWDEVEAIEASARGWLQPAPLQR